MNQTKVERTFNISQAAEILQVTDKTIRNYMDKGFIRAEKWNGAWRINRKNMDEIFYKKFGKNLAYNQEPISTFQAEITISRDEYKRLQKESGKLETVELHLRDRNERLTEVNERVIQLEASVASAWTEARNYKEGLNEAKERLQLAQKQAEDAGEESRWLRKEWERLQENQKEAAGKIDALQTSLHEKEEALMVFRAEFQSLTRIR